MKLEELPANPLRAELVETDAKDVRGLDLLGLRAPAEGVAVRLLDGVTTITPTVRYFSLRSWIILRYLKLAGLNEWKSFSAFAAKVEAALAFASALSADKSGGIVGSDLAASTVQKTDGPLTLTRLTKILAVSVYAGPSENLGLGDTQGVIPGLTSERGLPLAEEFDHQVKDDEVLYAISESDATQTINRDRLAALGTRISMSRPPAEEREHLLRAIFPTLPREQELPRIASYCLLLHTCKFKSQRVGELDVFDIASASSLTSVPDELHFICDGWTRFIVRDLLVLLHEAAVSLVLSELEQSPSPDKRRPLRHVIAGLVGEDLNLGLIGLGFESLSADDSISKLVAAVVERMGHSTELRGLRRWDGTIRESTIFEKAEWTRSPVGLAMLPIGWILACSRLEPGVVAQLPGFDLEGLAGTSRMGIAGVLLPEIRRWRSSSETIRSTVAWLLKRSVDQHLRIAWSRLAREPHKDVSLLQSDGDEWVFLKNMRPGRATSRLYQALNWLDQLELVHDSGLTERGEVVLAEGLATLRRCRGAGR